MLKKNKKIYLLLGLVLFIWGFIGFKVVNAINPPPDRTEPMSTPQKFKPVQLKQRDTFSITADYRDPFLGTLSKPKVSIIKGPKKIKRKQLPEKKITYSGYITDTDSSKKVFFLSIDGQQLMLSKNETFLDVKLVSGNKHKVTVRYNGKRKTIPLEE